MKVSKILKVDNKFNFEAPILKASTKLNKQLSTKITSERIDLNDMLIPNPDNVFLVKVNGDSMIGSMILDGDILIVDKKQKAKDGDIVVSSLNGEMTVKTFKIVENKAYLFSSNDKFLPLELSEFFKFDIQGVVKHVIRNTD